MLAIVFPGQGSQTLGMACDFAAQFPESRAVLEEADEDEAAVLALILFPWNHMSLEIVLDPGVCFPQGVCHYM